MKKLIARRKNFAQLEDFNSGSKNEEYHKEYMARMAGEKRGGEKPGYSDESSGMKKRKKQAAAEDSKKKSPPSEGPKIRKRAKKWAEALPWANTENTNVLYSLIESNEVDALEEMISTNPDVVHSRYVIIFVLARTLPPCESSDTQHWFHLFIGRKMVVAHCGGRTNSSVPM